MNPDPTEPQNAYTTTQLHNELHVLQARTARLEARYLQLQTATDKLTSAITIHIADPELHQSADAG